MVGNGLNLSDPSSPTPEGLGSPDSIEQTAPPSKAPFLKLAFFAMGIPALVCLLAIREWRYRMIHGDTWFLAGNYMDASRSGSWISALFTRLNDHWLVPCKAGLFAGFQWLGRDVDCLTVLAWISALIVAGWVAKESREWLASRPQRHILSVWLVVALFMFTLGQTYFLLWEACFFLHFPLIALLIMIEVLRSKLHWLARALIATIAGAGSVLSFSMGIVPVIAVYPVIWFCGRPDRVKTTLVWTLLTSLLAVLQFSGMRTANTESATVQRILHDPWQAVDFVIAILGSPLAWGTVVDPSKQGIFFGMVGLGVLSLLALTLWKKRNTPDLLANAAPWISISLAGFGATLLITAGRVSDNLGVALTGRYVALALPFLLGIYLLSALLWGKKEGFGLATLFLSILLVLNWYAGALDMRSWNVKSRSEMASAALLPFLPLEALPGLDLVEGTERVRDIANFMREKGVLRRVIELPGIEPKDFRVRSELTKSRAIFRTLQPVEGGWLASGRAVQPETGCPPDLVLLTFEPEGESPRIVDTATPNMPLFYFENETRLRTHRDFYQGWQRIIAHDRIPPGKSGWIQAYAWDCNSLRLAPISGKHWIDQTSVGKTTADSKP
jgi:hypothetical protein